MKNSIDITNHYNKALINRAFGVKSKFYDSEQLKHIRERVYTVVITARKPRCCNYCNYRDTDSLHEVRNGEE